MPRYTIEEASRGATYRNVPGSYTVYSHDTYPRNSVLAGQPRRCYVESYDQGTPAENLAAARSAYPRARVLRGGATSYAPPNLSHLPDDEDVW